jgi:hypothetical protein
MEDIDLECAQAIGVFNGENSEKAWYYNRLLMELLDFFMLGWIQRLAFEMNVQSVVFTLKKRVIK